MKRSLGTTPCVVKDSSCHIMQGDFGETINGSKYRKIIWNAIQKHSYLKQFIIYIYFFLKTGGKDFKSVKGSKFCIKSKSLIGLKQDYQCLLQPNHFLFT